VQVPNNQLQFKNKDGVYTAQLNIFGRVSTLTNRVVQTFEDSVTRDYPESLYKQSMKLSVRLSKVFAIAAGIVPVGSGQSRMWIAATWALSTRGLQSPVTRMKAGSKLPDPCGPDRARSAKQIGTGQFVARLLQGASRAWMRIHHRRQARHLSADL